MEISYDEMQPEDWEQVHHLRSSAFNGPRTPDPDFPRLETGLILVAKADGNIVATAAAADFDQVFSGQPVAMAGVTGVVVAPHLAGNGVAGGLVRRLLAGAVERKQPISCLYPSTSVVYRALGFESAGTWAEFDIPFQAVHTKAPNGVTVEEVGPEAYDLVHGLHDEQAHRNQGWIIRNAWWWDRKQYMAANPTAHQRILLARDSNGPCAFAVVLNTSSSMVPVAIYDFKFQDLFGTPTGIQAIAAALNTYSTVAGGLITALPAHELGSLAFRPERAKIGSRSTWMQRIVNVEQAVTARPTIAFKGSVQLEITDALLAANNARFVLTSNGQASVETGGSGKVSIRIGDLSSLYTGFTSAASLAAAGKLSGADATDIDNLDRCFLGRAPTKIDFF